MRDTGSATGMTRTTGPHAPGWLVARPIAHRGLHDKTRGIVENSSAATLAAIAQDYAIECDVQITRDGEAMVFHDAALERLTGQSGFLRDIDAAYAQQLVLTNSTETVPTLAGLLDLIAGRTPLIIEIKSEFTGDMALLQRVATSVAAYSGPIAIKSFDPEIVAQAAMLCPGIPRGIVAQAAYVGAEWPSSQARLHALANLLHLPHSQPDFISWCVDDLPHAAPFLCRHLGHMPVMTWTVRTAEQRARAKEHADQMVFEGFMP